MPSDLKKAIFDSLTAGKQGVQAAFNPMRLGGPDAAGGLRAALFGGLGAATVPMMAMDEATLGVGNVISEDTGRAAAAVERAGYPGMAKGLAGGGVALGMAPFIGGMALDPEMGAAKAAGGNVLGRLAANGLPDSVMLKAQSIQALHGEKALADLVQEYADKGVPLFSHDLPMDEAARMGRANAEGFQSKQWIHGGGNPIVGFDETIRGSGAGGRSSRLASWGSDDPITARNYADLAARDAPIKRMLEQIDGAEKVAQKTGNWDEYERLVLESEALDKKMRDFPEQGQNVTPFRVSGRYSNVDAGGEIPNAFDGGLSRMIRDAESRGLAGVKIKNLDDTPGLTDQIANHIAVIDPSKMRSPYAAFDPRMKDSKFLLALKAGAIPLAGVSAFSQGEQ